MMGGEYMRKIMQEVVLMAGHHETNTPISVMVAHFGREFFPPSTDMPALADRLYKDVEEGDFDDGIKSEAIGRKVYMECLDILRTSSDKGKLSTALYAIIRVMYGPVQTGGEYTLLWNAYTGGKSGGPFVDAKENLLERVEHSYEEMLLQCII